jgi:hypothetical protein
MKLALQQRIIPKKCNYCKGYTRVYYFLYKDRKDFLKGKRLRLCVRCIDNFCSKKKDLKRLFSSFTF